MLKIINGEKTMYSYKDNIYEVVENEKKEIYYTEDNIYKVAVNRNKNEVIIYKIINVDPKNNKPIYGKDPILTYTYKNIFIGYNTILLEINPKNYTFIGKEIFSFTSYGNIVKYSGERYRPYGIDEFNNVYILYGWYCQVIVIENYEFNLVKMSDPSEIRDLVRGQDPGVYQIDYGKDPYKFFHDYLYFYPKDKKSEYYDKFRGIKKIFCEKSTCGIKEKVYEYISSIKDEIYYPRDNCENHYKVMVNRGNKEIIIYVHIDFDKKKKKYIYAKEPILSYKYNDIFIGRSFRDRAEDYDEIIEDNVYDKDFDGNTILIQTDSNNYIFIGMEIFSFCTYGKIVKYSSQVVGLGAVYSYAVDEFDNYYLFNTGENKVIIKKFNFEITIKEPMHTLNSALNKLEPTYYETKFNNKDPYRFYYKYYDKTEQRMRDNMRKEISEKNRKKYDEESEKEKAEEDKYMDKFEVLKIHVINEYAN